MALNKRQQTRLAYLQKNRPNDPQVAKLQAKGVNQGSLPVGRSQRPQIQPPTPNTQEFAAPQQQMPGYDPNQAQNMVDPGRYPQEQMGAAAGAYQAAMGQPPPQDLGQISAMNNVNVRNKFFGGRGVPQGARGQFVNGAMGNQQPTQQQINQSVPYGVLK